MKNYEKGLMKIFGGCVGIFILDLIYRCRVRGDELHYLIFDNFTLVLGILFIISLCGIITVIISTWIRGRITDGKCPISKCYSRSFYLSFVPFVLILMFSIYSAVTGFRLFHTTYGLKAIHDTLLIYGYNIFCIIIPVFPVCLFWQVLYIVKRFNYRKMMR